MNTICFVIGRRGITIMSIHMCTISIIITIIIISTIITTIISIAIIGTIISK